MQTNGLRGHWFHVCCLVWMKRLPNNKKANDERKKFKRLERFKALVFESMWRRARCDCRDRFVGQVWFGKQ